ncbi:hypothetical protein GCM10027396_18540 [Insolitispirillum peregrinum]
MRSAVFSVSFLRTRGVPILLGALAGVAAVGVLALFGGGSANKPVVVATPAKPGDCRTFHKTIPDGDRQRVVQGTVCLQNDGSWTLVPSQRG